MVYIHVSTLPMFYSTLKHKFSKDPTARAIQLSYTPPLFSIYMLLMTAINFAMHKYFLFQLYRNIVSEQISIKICLKHEFTSKFRVDRFYQYFAHE